MKVGILATHFAKGKPASSEPHLVNLIRAIVDVDDVNEYVVFARADNAACFAFARKNLRVVVLPGLSRYPSIFRAVYEQVIVPLIMVAGRFDVLHFNANVGPTFPCCRTTGTIHWTPDRLTMAEFTWFRRAYFRLLFRFSVRRATRLIAVSDACKAAAVSALGLDPDRVVVIHHGVSDRFRKSRARRTRLALPMAIGEMPRRFLLAVTSGSRYKGLDVLLRAFVKARSEHGVAEPLVLVGNVDRAALDALERDIDPAFPWDTSVITTGYLPYEQLPAIYERAAALVYYSLRETFGIPVVEAMASGVPVIVSDIPALREVAGPAALVVDLGDIDGLARLMKDSVARDMRIRRLIRAGSERARLFSWERAARATVATYEACADGTNVSTCIATGRNAK